MSDAKTAKKINKLLHAAPTEVYAAFALDAWRYQYDLDPRKAARFAEEYTNRTGKQLDLVQAFGLGAEAVANALYRRYHLPSPFDIAKKKLGLEGKQELEEIKRSYLADCLQTQPYLVIFVEAHPINTVLVLFGEPLQVLETWEVTGEQYLLLEDANLSLYAIPADGVQNDLKVVEDDPLWFDYQPPPEILFKG